MVHTHKVGGSSPPITTKSKDEVARFVFFILLKRKGSPAKGVFLFICLLFWTIIIIIKHKGVVMIEEQIKKANIEAMKNKDALARSFYSVLINKILLEKIAKGQRDQLLADTDVSNIIQKVIKELNDEKENYAKVNNAEQVSIIEKQIEIASSYLPKQLSADEIKAIILSLEDKSIPNVMKHFKANFNGQVDMRQVQEVLKALA